MTKLRAAFFRSQFVPRFAAKLTLFRRTTHLSLSKVSLLSMFIFALLLGITQGSAVAEDSAGTDVYKAKCLTCHAKDGSGNTPVGKSLQSADLRSPEVQKKP